LAIFILLNFQEKPFWIARTDVSEADAARRHRTEHRSQPLEFENATPHASLAQLANGRWRHIIGSRRGARMLVLSAPRKLGSVIHG
jgi:hypothetical protein